MPEYHREHRAMHWPMQVHKRLALVLLVGALGLISLLAHGSVAAQEGAPTAAVPLRREETVHTPGEPLTYEPAGDGEPYSCSKSGYASATSVVQGGTIDFHISSDCPTFDIYVYREGATKELITIIRDVHAGAYPCASSELGCAWPVAYRLQIPRNWRSGLYAAQLVEPGEGAGDQGEYILFVVREDMPASTSRILVQLSINTWNAYTDRYGLNFYTTPRAMEISYDRPFTRQPYGTGPYQWEIPFIRWLESSGYTAEYCTNVDVHYIAGLLDHYRLFVSIGHDEYWSKEMRDHVEGFISRGGNVAFLGSNTCYWQVRLEDDGRKIVCYKDDFQADPLFGVNNSRVTHYWTGYPVNRPENSMTGVSYHWGGIGAGGFRVYHADHWIYEGTGLRDGDVFGATGSGIMAVEVDGNDRMMVNGYPVVTGSDGTPLSFTILGLPATLGSATLGVYTRNNGQVFTTGTWGWSAQGLRDNMPEVVRITRNVIDRFTQLAAPPTPTPSVTPTAPPVPTIVTLQRGLNGYTGVQDTYLHSWYPDTNYNTRSTMSIRPAQISSLIRFELQNYVPANATIQKAMLYLYAASSGGNLMTSDIYKVLRPWNAAQATWRLAGSGTPWAVAGCDGVGTDRASTLVDRERMHTANGWYTYNVSDLVREWIADPGSNYGVVVKSYYHTATQFDMATSEHLTQFYRPKLVIYYVIDNAATPTATSTPMATATATWTPTRTLGVTPTPSSTPTSTQTPTVTPTPVPTSETTTRILQQGLDGYSGVHDTYLHGWYPDTAYGSNNSMNVRSGGVMQPLIKFDLSSIPPNAVIRNATLYLYCNFGGTYATTVDAYRVRRPWSAAEATWNRASAATAWAIPGCGDTLTDRYAVSTHSVQLSSSPAWYAFDLTNLAAIWVQDPSQNQGVVLIASGPTSVQYSFASSEYWYSNFRPRLEITYSGAVGPAPTATNTLTVGPTPTPTWTPTVGNTPTWTATPTASATPVASLTPTPSATATPLPTGSASPTVVVLQEGLNGYGGADDTYLNAWSPSSSYATYNTLAVRTGNIMNALLRFDTSAIPSNATVLDAILQINVVGSGAYPMTVDAYRVNRAWLSSEANWNRARANVPWGAPGCDQVPGDREGTPAASVAVSPYATQYDLPIKNMVQAWVSNPGQNAGLILKSATTTSLQYTFASKEHWSLAMRPKLIITYVLGSLPPTNTPAATRTPTHTPTSTLTMTPGLTATVTPTATPTPTVLQSATPSPTVPAGILRLRAEAESGTLSGTMAIHRDATASNCEYVSSSAGSSSVCGAGGVSFNIYVPRDDNYRIFTRVWAPDETRNSFWVSVDDGYNYIWNPPPPGSSSAGLCDGNWCWDSVSDWSLELDPIVFFLPRGDHTIRFCAREADTRLDLIELTTAFDFDTAITPCPVTPTPQSPGVIVDTYLNAWAVSTNYGTDWYMRIRAGNVKVGLMRTDLSHIPTTATVTRATLRIYVAGSDRYPITLYAHRVNRAWVAGEATWERATAGQPWAAAGCQNVPGDYDGTPYATQIASTVGTWVDFDLRVLAQEWVADPSRNFGILLRGQTPAGEYSFATSDHQSAGLRPQFDISWTP